MENPNLCYVILLQYDAIPRLRRLALHVHVHVLRTDALHDNRTALAPFSKSTLRPLLIAKMILKKLPPIIILHLTCVQYILYDLGWLLISFPPHPRRLESTSF